MVLILLEVVPESVSLLVYKIKSAIFASNMEWLTFRNYLFAFTYHVYSEITEITSSIDAKTVEIGCHSSVTAVTSQT